MIKVVGSDVVQADQGPTMGVVVNEPILVKTVCQLVGGLSYLHSRVVLQFAVMESVVQLSFCFFDVVCSVLYHYSTPFVGDADPDGSVQH